MTCPNIRHVPWLYLIFNIFLRLFRIFFTFQFFHFFSCYNRQHPTHDSMDSSQICFSYINEILKPPDVSLCPEIVAWTLLLIWLLSRFRSPCTCKPVSPRWTLCTHNMVQLSQAICRCNNYNIIGGISSLPAFVNKIIWLFASLYIHRCTCRGCWRIEKFQCLNTLETRKSFALMNIFKSGNSSAQPRSNNKG